MTAARRSRGSGDRRVKAELKYNPNKGWRARLNIAEIGAAWMGPRETCPEALADAARLFWRHPCTRPER